MIGDELHAAFASTLLSGGYNLLFGSGVSLDSRNDRGELLPSGEELRRALCALTGAPETTSLPRVYGLLTEEQRKAELTQKFRDCRPGTSLLPLPRFLWRRLFTLNIDDVIENLYAGALDAKQSLVPINYDAQFEPTPDRSEIQTVHLHGWVQRPGVGYVFAHTEYARVMRNLNPWMHLLSEILASEPFIVAGTSLNEIDLEYYLSHRTSATPRKGRGPSLLIHPNPDVVTYADCERHGLTLVKATIGEFLEWLTHEFPSPPRVADLVVPDTSSLFSCQPQAQSLLRFFSDFELVQSADVPRAATPSGFMYGREPSWQDLNQHCDIERQASTSLLAEVRARVATESTGLTDVLCVLDGAGAGKTTAARRVAHDLAHSGVAVFSLSTTSKIDSQAARQCIRQLAGRAVLLVDGLADHVAQVAELLDEAAVAERVVVLGTERSYRRDYIELVLGAQAASYMGLGGLDLNESLQLLERYREFGLVASSAALKDPTRFARELLGEPAAVAICRILNDFRPLGRIIDSLWDAASEEERLPYMCVALSEYCHKTGLIYSLLQRIAGPRMPIGPLFDVAKPLPLAESAIDSEYVVAYNSVIADRLLHKIARTDRATMLEVFLALAEALAPHVNRLAIMARSPEARLAGRLFDFDKVVGPLLKESAHEFYLRSQPEWEWNSRYWEQRALLAAESDLQTAVQYARHAVAIEHHPYPLTTLGTVLLREMEATPSRRDLIFAEAFDVLCQAIDAEAKRSRITVHPFCTLLHGAARFREAGGELTQKQRRLLDVHVNVARSRFRADPQVVSVLQRFLCT